MKKIVVACDSFKGSLSSLEVGLALKEGLCEVCPNVEISVVAVADGGEGMLEAILDIKKGKRVECDTVDPLGRPLKAYYGVIRETAIIEMSQASGLCLLSKEERNPAVTSTVGLGLMIKDALKKGYQRFLVGLGGSATNDAGVGMLQALGFDFYDECGEEVEKGGINLRKIRKIDNCRIEENLKTAEFIVACDVNNPLTGKNGASYIFGPQKGADLEMVRTLDESLSHFAEVVEKRIGVDCSDYPGSGAAGGVGYAFMSFLNAKLRSGVDIILEEIEFDKVLEGASLVVTGEGRLDNQTLSGKTPSGVLACAQKNNIPVIAIGGSIAPDAKKALLEAGFSAVYAVTPDDMPLERAMKKDIAKENVRKIAIKLISILRF